MEVIEHENNESLASRMFWLEWFTAINVQDGRVDTRPLRLEVESVERFNRP